MQLQISQGACLVLISHSHQSRFWIWKLGTPHKQNSARSSSALRDVGLSRPVKGGVNGPVHSRTPRKNANSGHVQRHEEGQSLSLGEFVGISGGTEPLSGALFHGHRGTSSRGATENECRPKVNRLSKEDERSVNKKPRYPSISLHNGIRWPLLRSSFKRWYSPALSIVVPRHSMPWISQRLPDTFGNPTTGTSTWLFSILFAYFFSNQRHLKA